MILTCPECATSYFVDDLRIPRGGRMVKCSTCGARWRAHQERVQPEADDALQASATAEPPPLRPAPPDDDLDVVVAPVAPRRRPEPEPKRPIGLYVTAGVAVGLVAIAGAALLLRQQLVAALPSTAPLFAAVGLPVNATGLVIEGVKSQAVLDGGRPALSITGAIRNTRGAAVQSPPIRISLLDRAGKPVTTALYRPLNAKVPPGARRYFAISLAAPPSDLHELEIGFEAGKAQVLPTAEAPSTAEAGVIPQASPVTQHE